MSRNVLYRLLYGEVDSPAPFTTLDEAAAVLDHLADLDEKAGDPTGKRAVEILATALRHDLDVRRLLAMLSPAVLLDDPSEERTPSAQVALEAHRAIERLEALTEGQARDEAWWKPMPRVVRALLPTVLHARYVLSILVVRHEESGEAKSPPKVSDVIFRLVSEVAVEFGDDEAADRHYVKRLYRRLWGQSETTRAAEGAES